MKPIIGADATKLANLQIDTLQKVRSGQITLDQWKWFNNLSVDDREARFGNVPTVPAENTEKFKLLVDLGVLTVPNDYVHDKQLATFKNKYSKNVSFCPSCNDIMKDANFPNPTRILKPGDKLRVRVFDQIVDGDTTTSEECMTFLAKRKAIIHTNAQGLSLVFEQKRDQLPKDKCYSSFDEKGRLWTDDYGRHWMANIFYNLNGDFKFDLGCFEHTRRGNCAFLCFESW